MSKEGEFLIYCLEMYRRAKGLSGKAAFDLFRKTGVDDYIMKCFGALHTTGENYILSDIDGFIAGHAASCPS